MVQPRKTRPYITERLLVGRKETNQTKTKKQSFRQHFYYFVGENAVLANASVNCRNRTFSAPARLFYKGATPSLPYMSGALPLFITPCPKINYVLYFIFPYGHRSCVFKLMLICSATFCLLCSLKWEIPH